MEPRCSTDSVADALAQHERVYPQDPRVTVPISQLQPALDSPRLNGEDVEHVRTLASSEAVLPPILVHRDSFRVIDGSHRLRAATLRGAETIDVVYFDGSEQDAFVVAVMANTTHGMPLSIVDRKAAAVRILNSFPQWSDRVIAKVTGLAAKTVAALRCPTEEEQQLDGRVGMDGRIRPVNRAAGRLRAAEIIRDKPEASLREIAHAAGVSPMTARDVRARLERGDAPVPENQPSARTASYVPQRVASSRAEQVTDLSDPMVILQKLRRDPSLCQTEFGRMLLRRLDAQARGLADCPANAEQVPPHCLYALAEIAHAFADRWWALAEELEQRLRRM